MKSRKLFLLLLFCLVFVPSALLAQMTKIKGRVTDGETGEGIPFAGVYFKDSKVGVYTDLDGYYSLETRDLSLKTLCVSILGYESAELDANAGNFAKLDFVLKPVASNLNAVVVKPDDHYLRSILHKISDNKHKNDPKHIDAYSSDVYTKMELDLTHPREQIKNKTLVRNFGFIFDYIDTSVVSGQPYLPFLISENVGKKYHSTDPEMDKELIEASRISGFNNNSNMLQFTGSMYLRVNFYDNYINAFNLDIPSPLCGHGTMYYNYFLVDSLQTDGRKTYVIRFHPGKNISSVAFDGEMQIDAQDYAMRKMHARLQKRANINWVRDLIIDVEHRKIGDSTWFYSREKSYADFSVTMNDSSKALSLLGNRELIYSNVVFGKDSFPDNKVMRHRSRVYMEQREQPRTEAFWDSLRPYELTTKERDIYAMVDSIKSVPMYQNIVSVLTTLFSGYFDTKYVGFGPYQQFFSFNDLEGFRMQFGARTTKDFSKKWRLMAYGAYGFRDKEFKGGGSVEYVFSRDPFRKLTFKAYHDAKQGGASKSHFSESSLFVSIFSKGDKQKRSMVNEFSLNYEHEHTPGFTSSFTVETKNVSSNENVPMVTPEGEWLSSVSSTSMSYSARFSFDESSVRGTYERSFVPSRKPIITVDLSYGLKGLTKRDFSYFRPEISLVLTPPIPPFGASTVRFNAGKIFGKVPYPFLKIHEGNGTYFLDRNAFTCMDFYEFASDTWVSLMYEHNFNGYFLGKIPFLKRLNWREALNVKAVYGTLSDRNNGGVDNEGHLVSENADPYIVFPLGMGELNKPYVEAGFGITNIFKLFRVDFNWRLTHRYKEVLGDRIKNDNFSVTIGFELQF